MFWNVYFLNSISLNRERAYLLNHAAFHLLRWGFVWSWLSSKYFQAKALVTYGMIVLVMLGKAKIGNIYFGTTESVFVIKIYCLYFFIMSAISFWQGWQWQWWRWWHDNDNGYEKDDDDDDGPGGIFWPKTHSDTHLEHPRKSGSRDMSVWSWFSGAIKFYIVIFGSVQVPCTRLDYSRGLTAV